MVRNIVGSLVEVGRGARRPAGSPSSWTARPDRAPPRRRQGLFLVRVLYGLIEMPRAGLTG